MEQQISCSGRLELPFIGEGSRQVYNNWTGQDDGEQDIHRAFTRSCNVYFWEIAYEIWSSNQGTEQESVLQDWARDFGFGEPTGVDLPFERSGLVPDRALFELWKEESPQRLDPAVDAASLGMIMRDQWPGLAVPLGGQTVMVHAVLSEPPHHTRRRGRR